MCNKNFKFLKKGIEEDNRKLKDLPCSMIGRINIMKIVEELGSGGGSGGGCGSAAVAGPAEGPSAVEPRRHRAS